MASLWHSQNWFILSCHWGPLIAEKLSCKIRLKIIFLSTVIQAYHPYAFFWELIVMLPLRCPNRVLGISYDFSKYSQGHCYMLGLIIKVLKTKTKANSQVGAGKSEDWLSPLSSPLSAPTFFLSHVSGKAGIFTIVCYVSQYN